MVVIIDNYDSFVFNLARYIRNLGCKTQIYRNDKISVQEVLQLNPSHIILSPGPCTPDQAGICLDLVKMCYRKIPILGVCLGHQVIGQAFGAKIVSSSYPMHGQASIIQHNGDGVFCGVPDNISVARYHSLVISTASILGGVIT